MYEAVKMSKTQLIGNRSTPNLHPHGFEEPEPWIVTGSSPYDRADSGTIA